MALSPARPVVTSRPAFARRPCWPRVHIVQQGRGIGAGVRADSGCRYTAAGGGIDSMPPGFHRNASLASRSAATRSSTAGRPSGVSARHAFTASATRAGKFGHRCARVGLGSNLAPGDERQDRRVAERLFSREEAIRQHTDGEHIGGRSQRRAPGELRRHVGRGARYRPRARELRARLVRPRPRRQACRRVADRLPLAERRGHGLRPPVPRRIEVVVHNRAADPEVGNLHDWRAVQVARQ